MIGSCRLEHGALGNDALGDIAPQGDEEFAGQRHDGDAADSSLAGADPRLKPAAQRRSRLVAQPEPGKLNHGVPQATIARLGDALIPFDAAALPGAGRQSSICCYLASVAEAAKQRFKPEERRELRAHALELEELGGGVVPLLRFRADERVAGAFDRSQLRRHHRDPIEFPAYFRLQRRRQLTAIAGWQRLESFETISPKRIVIPDALAAEQAPNPIGMLNAFLEQRAALARQAPAILFFRARRANHGTDPPLATSPGHQRPQQGLAVDRIGLGPPMPPVDRDRSRIDHVALDPVGEQQAMNPKPVQSRFLNDDRLHLHPIALTGLRSRARKKVEQAGAVSALDHMLGKLLAARTVDRHNPLGFAQFERGEQRVIIRAGGGRDNGRGGDGLHRLPPCWWGSSAYQVRPPSTRIGSVMGSEQGKYFPCYFY